MESMVHLHHLSFQQMAPWVSKRENFISDETNFYSMSATAKQANEWNERNERSVSVYFEHLFPDFWTRFLLEETLLNKTLILRQ